MNDILVNLKSALAAFDTWEWTIMALNVVLLFSANRIFQKYSQREDDQKASVTRAFKAINLLILLWLVFANIILKLEDESRISQFISAVMAFYIGYLTYLVYAYFINQKFGRVRTIDDRILATETYNSRALRLLGGILICVITLISVVQIFGLEDLTKAGGVIGFVGVLLALTQGAWAPDLISGLIILNSGVVRQGDVIEVETVDGTTIAVVFRIKLFHTEILDLVNNHRIMNRNAKFRDLVIHNLSRFASAKGLREKLSFKIGYDAKPSSVEAMFRRAFKNATTDSGPLHIEAQYPPDIRVLDTGDDAVTWGFFYYTKNIKQLVSTRQRMRYIILEESNKSEIQLATPRLQDVVSVPHPPDKTPPKTV